MMSKRTLDVIGACVGIIILSPVFIVIALLIKFKLGSPVIFRQTRPGFNGTPFKNLKFRTMTNAIDCNGNLLPDADRITQFGKFLRETSLDEFPALINVLKGEMSLVGPRPLLMEYLTRYSKQQARRHEIRPGLTGWAQVMGRNAISWEKKFELDVWYVDNWSFLLDLKIIFMSARQVILRHGINANGHATMPEFLGASEEIP